MRSALLFVLLLAGAASAVGAPPPASLPDDLPAAVAAAQVDRRPVLLLVRRPGDVASLDAWHWLAEDASLRPLLAKLHAVAVWSTSPALKSLPAAPRAGMLFLTPAGEVIASERVPDLRAGMRDLLAKIVAHPKPAADLIKQAEAAPANAALARRAAELLQQAGKGEQAAALLRAALAVRPAPPAQMAALLQTQLADVEISACRLRSRRLRMAVRQVEAYQGTQPAPAGMPADQRARLLSALDMCSGGGDTAEQPLAHAVGDARKLLAEPPAGAQPAELDRQARASLAKLLPLVTARADALEQKAQKLEKEFATSHPDDVDGLLRTLRAATSEQRRDPKAESEAPKVVAQLLAAKLSPEAWQKVAEPMASAVISGGLSAERTRLSQKLARDAGAGRAVAAALLDLADEALANGARDEAAAGMDAAIRAAAGESPCLYRAARAMRSLAAGPVTPARARWAGRQVLDVVVLAPDLPAFAAAIGRWTDKTFFPVLFADDLYAPRFIAAFKPARVVLLPASNGDGALSPEDLRRALLSSWGGRGKATDDALRGRLRSLRAPADGVVFTDGSAGETAGGLALAAGRFEGLEFLSAPKVGQGKEERPSHPGDWLSADAAGAMAAQVQAGLARWGLPRNDRWASVTLAGSYPFNCHGETYANWGDACALDDLLGRDGNTERIAAVGRLLGDGPRSAYQAACSLFLRPDSALLFNTYGTNPHSIWGFYRMEFAEAAWKDRLAVTSLHDADANIETFRARTDPWNHDGLIMINSSGGATGWSVGGGGGNSDDFPVGVPCAIHVTHSGSAADPYNPDTLAGRAIWGGAFFYFGSTAEPFLTSFQPPRYYAPRIAGGAPFAATFRQRPGQQFWQPWRLMIVGDPEFCLREKPAVRAPVRAGRPLVMPGEVLLAGPGAKPWKEPGEGQPYSAWLGSLRRFRWTDHHAGARALLDRLPETMPLDDAGLAMALEEDLLASDCAKAMQRWARATDEARKGYAARVYARQAAGSLLDKALAAKDLPGMQARLLELVTTAPSGDFVSRWLGKLAGIARERKEEGALAAWLTTQAGDPRCKGYEAAFTKQAEQLRAKP